MTSPPGITLTATDLGEYVRHHSCDWRFHLAVRPEREVAALPFFDRLRDTIDPVLAGVGRRREDQWEAELAAAGFRDLAADLPKESAARPSGPSSRRCPRSTRTRRRWSPFPSRRPRRYSNW